MLLGEVLCTTCNGAGLELRPDGSAQCRFCGALNHPGNICPQCLSVNGDTDEACGQCGSALAQTCPVCRTRNWIGRQTCLQCRTPLDTLSYVTDRYRQGTPAAQREHTRQMRDLKAQEEEGSRRRLAELNEIEARRLAALREANARRLAEERRFLNALFIGLGLFVAIMLIIAAATLLFR